MNHSFNVELATKYGIEEAILIENLAFWIKKNIANNVNYVNGEYWTYNTAKALEELFPYMNLKKIQRILVKLESLGVIKSDNYNSKTYDRTKWYSIIDEDIKKMYQLEKPLDKMSNEKSYGVSTNNTDKKALDKMSNEKNIGLTTEECKPLDKMSNAMFKNVQPIPDINSDIKIKTTTIQENKNKIDHEKNSSSSSPYEFLNNYKINTGTKMNIRKYIKNLTEDKFLDAYNQVLSSFNNGEIDSFEAVLYKALKGEWTFKTPVTFYTNSDVEKDRKLVKAQANYWLSYFEVGYTPTQIINNFLNSVHHCNAKLVEEYKTKMQDYLKKRGA